MNILAKYNRLRPYIKHGDIILFHGKGVLARIIQNCDSAYWNHVGVVIEVNGALFIVDSNASGVQADRLSWRIKKYKGGDFAIIQPDIPKEVLNYHMTQLLKRADDKWIRYDFVNGAKELANRKFGWKLKIVPTDDRDICSDWIRRYAEGIDVVTEEFRKTLLVFPHDYDRYFNRYNAFFIKD